MRKNIVIIALLLVNIFSVKYAINQQKEAEAHRKATEEAIEMHARYIRNASDVAEMKMVVARKADK